MTTITHTPLSEIFSKIETNKRLTAEDGLQLLNTKDVNEIATIKRLANEVRKKKAGDTVTFASTLYIHPTNLCELNCPFCSYYAKPGWKKAWFLTPEQIEEKIRANLHAGLTEIHIVGGLWKECNLEYYKDVFGRIRAIDPNLHIKALTAVEYDFLSKLHGISVEEVLLRMMSYGLGSLPGGGAEILVEEIRKKLAPGKITSDEYLAIHALAHRLGLSSNVSMLFGSIETEEHIIAHLMRVREVQDRTDGFKAFIPLKFGLENNALGKRKGQLREKNSQLVYAVSRLMLDNIPHLKVLWNYVGVQEALEILQCGADDFSSTNLEEKIIVMAGSEERKMDKETLSELIRSIGRVPKLIHTGQM